MKKLLLTLFTLAMLMSPGIAIAHEKHGHTEDEHSHATETTSAMQSKNNSDSVMVGVLTAATVGILVSARFLNKH